MIYCNEKQSCNTQQASRPNGVGWRLPRCTGTDPTQPTSFGNATESGDRGLNLVAYLVI